MQPVILDQMPPRLLDRTARELHRDLDGPTLIHLPGRDPHPLFVSVLQHGNEHSGWEAVRRLLRGRYARDPLPRSLALFIGNVRAAARGRRHLADQPDFNRCWAPGDAPPTRWHRLFDAIIEHMRALKPFASVDIHNNTGLNPHYAAVNHLQPQALQLAARFSRTVIYFTEPAGVQSAAFGAFCPAVTLECGLADETGGSDHAMTYLENVLNLAELPGTMPTPEQLEVFQVAATVRVPLGIPFGFDDDGPGIRLSADIERLNFTELPPGTRLARIQPPATGGLLAQAQDGSDSTGDWFTVDGGEVRTRRASMPAMLTTNPEIVSQDCLCYLMERLHLARPSGDARDHAGLPETLP